ncbi:disease resistance protein RPS2-like [Gastrolobium bilobum]|uniref:disease resistance protein RPS2-like n=1 Tax=Gastrolobium bilobum TaxID=150636 RepID=UPI002AAFFF87|nr:disease resistance protein RPS2-like [Gastrolobium bilobum]
MREPMPMDGVDEDLVKFYKSLRFSYDRMASEKAKRLFLLCSMFLEDKELSIEILTKLGIGAGLFGEIDGKYNDARSQVVVAKNKLIDSCLLLKADEGRVKMHDFVREVAQWIDNNKIQTVNLSKEGQKPRVEEDIKYLLLKGRDKDLFSCSFDRSKLQILIVHWDRGMDGDDLMDVPNSFFQNMTELRVLRLSSKPWGIGRLSLPESFESLNIRSLIFKRLRISDISILGKLQNLEALDLVYCEVVELPREIAELEKLRLLNLDQCEIERNNAFEVIERCKSLEELYFNEFKIDNTTVHKKITLPSLQRYDIRDEYDYETYNSMSKYVCVSNIDTYFCEATFKYLAKTSEVLKLEGFEGGWSNLIPEIVDEGMKDLVKLCLQSWSKLQCLIDTSHINSPERNFFSKLAVLELDKMENLKELCNGPFPSDFLKNLETLSIKECQGLRSILFKSKLNLSNLKFIRLKDCPKLVTLFQLSTSQSLVHLEELCIRNCRQLENIIADERAGEELREEIVDGDQDEKRRKSRCSMFPNLKALYIDDCPRLEFILLVLFAQDLPLLKTVSIKDCGELKYIFGKYQHENEEMDLHQEVKDVVLRSLDKLLLYRLPNFIDIFPECDHPKFSSVKRSSSKSEMQLEPMKCNIFPWTHKYRHKWRSSTSAQIPSHHCSASSVTLSASCGIFCYFLLLIDSRYLVFIVDEHIKHPNF